MRIRSLEPACDSGISPCRLKNSLIAVTSRSAPAPAPWPVPAMSPAGDPHQGVFVTGMLQRFVKNDRLRERYQAVRIAMNNENGRQLGADVMIWGCTSGCGTAGVGEPPAYPWTTSRVG